ncbi:YitT family protein (plasmid) [Cytobacillus spongiae]|uniref:YitT family protein n=1 Tax=Cytobacillus spongiae TaxID=2901381 RepID=UPI001F2B2878|nr:YitT family protein [Cytobacillus spongiae]UII58188.1 YitT family protein [Cytobacillus spongiae]
MNVARKGIILGVAATVQGLAMAVFLFPHFIPSGGAASVSVLLHHLLNVPFAVSLWMLNACLLLAAIKWLGKENAIWTLYCVSVTSYVVNLMSPLVSGTISFVIVDLLIGSILFGTGVGILFRMGASSGGMDILALIVSKLKGYSPGKTLFFINGSLLILTGMIVDLKIILFALICQFISTRIVDIMFQIHIKRNFISIEHQ